MSRYGLVAALTVSAAITLAGCGHHPAIRAGLGSVTANPTISRDITQAESRLAGCARKHGLTSHARRQATIACAFPGGSLTAIENYAVRIFTIRDLTSKRARDAWYQAIAAYALNLGATPSPSPSGSSR